MKRPIITRGLIVEIPERRVSPKYRIGDSVQYRFPSIFDPTYRTMGFGRTAEAIIESIGADVVRLRVLLNN